ncbi:Cyclin-H [Toxocara canis]|uniref:Cyclin-H n=1 Tax=Toxocara canis TaxID=6265 RepID=A0A0B2W460_TOXCA|nr:Cyclin-H [Toxocara canis]
MYSSSTQKAYWTFSSQEAITALRVAANERFRAKYEHVKKPGEEDVFLTPDEETILRNIVTETGIRVAANERFRAKYEHVKKPGEEDVFLTPDEETILRNIVTETGIRFAEDFRPAMWLSVRWTAFAYYPNGISLRSGTAKTNAETILSLEPEIMLKLNYHLTMHAPFRPFEGHLIEMKTRSLLGFDLEQVRPHSNDFFKKALMGDVMLLYSPSQIALAALKYALQKLDKSDDLLKDQFLYKLLNVDTWQPQNSDVMLCEKLITRLDKIIAVVLASCEPVTKEANAALQSKMQRWVSALPELERRLSESTNIVQNENSNTNSGFNSDDDD